MARKENLFSRYLQKGRDFVVGRKEEENQTRPVGWPPRYMTVHDTGSGRR